MQILLSGICFGFLGIFGKTAYQHGLTPGELLSLRFFSAGLLVLCYLAIFDRQRLRLTWQEALWSIALGALGYAVFSFFYFQALSGLSASLTVLLLYLYPVLVPVGAWVFLGEKISRDRWLVLPTAMAGLILLVAGEIYMKNAVAFGLGVASAVFYSIYILCSSRFLANADTLASAGIMQLSAGVVLCLATWRDGQRLVDVVTHFWPLIIGMAVICSVMAMTFFLSGLQKLKNWEVSVLSTAEPVTAVAIAFLFLNESLSLQQIIGGLLVLGAFIALSLPSRSAKNPQKQDVSF